VFKQFWDYLEQNFGRRGRMGVLVGAGAILVIAAGAGYFLLQPDYQVLFSDLGQQDMAALTAELDRQKIPYQLSQTGDGSGVILVEGSEVYRTRLKLMGKEIPLHGAVGFELFDTSDFGMTEFAQKVNYQRALQGELTRTILSLASIRDARVILVLPEQGLLKPATSKPKASVAVTMKPDQTLRTEQIAGIQRLVASAVAGIAPEDVTVIDQNGVALTRPGGEADAMPAHLDMKRDMEAYLTHKAGQVLDQILGPGQAIASVDVTLDMDRVQSNTDEVLGAPNKQAGAPTGVVLRERETTPELSEPLSPHTGAAAYTPMSGGTSQREVEYAVTHHVEQIASQPGAIRRVQLAIVVKKPLSAAQQDQLRKTVAASVGAVPERGDTVVLQSLDEVAAPAAAAPWTAPDAMAAPDHAAAAGPAGRRFTFAELWPIDSPTIGMAVFGGSAVLLILAIVTPRPSRRRRPLDLPVAQLTDAQRALALQQVRAWMVAGPRESVSRSVTR
jgi:flagellar M-ring protein FliF